MTGVGATGAGGMDEEHSCCEKGLSSRSGESMAVVRGELEAAMENCQRERAIQSLYLNIIWSDVKQSRPHVWLGIRSKHIFKHSDDLKDHNATRI